MDLDLNRAATKRYRAFIAIGMGIAVPGILKAEEPQYPITHPQRISAAAPSFEKVDGPRRMPSSDDWLIVREPSSQPFSPVTMTRSGSTRTNGKAKHVDFNPPNLETEISELPPPTQAMRDQALPEETSVSAASIDVESVMRVFAEPIVPGAQVAARKEKASREKAFNETFARTSSRLASHSSQMILPGFSVSGLRAEAAKSLDEAAIALSTGANLTSAEASTEALRKIAQSIDIQRSDNLASADLAAAFLAIHEAEDFVGRYGAVDQEAIARMVRAHQTTVLKGYDTSNLTGIGAADVYMDFARHTLGSIASADPLAAHALGLLGKSYRNRSQESPMALAASVHLMRAAASALPNDRGLVTELVAVLDQAKLVDEAGVVRKHISGLPLRGIEGDVELGMSTELAVADATTMGPGGTRRAIRIEQIRPEVFASISRSEAGPSSNSVAVQETASNPNSPVASKNPAQTFDSQAMYGSPLVSPSSVNVATAPGTDGEGNTVSRAFKSMTRIWR